MKILLKITSRERPDQCQEAVQSFIHHAKNKSDLILAFALDTDDRTIPKYLKFINDLASLPIHLNVGYSKNKIEAINRGVPDVDWQVLVNISDDTRCIKKDWDVDIKTWFAVSLDRSLWTFDGIQNRINTHEIVGRDYFDRTELIYPIQYKSFFCDNFTTLEAKLSGKQIKVNTQILVHQHPQSSKFRKDLDSLYKRNEKYWQEDEAQWKKDEQLLINIYK